MKENELKRTKVNYTKYLEEALEQMPKGAFLTVKTKDKINSMAIGWATSGIIWEREVLTVAVRPSRYTFEGMDLDKEFTVSIPINQNLEKELKYFGTHSGRDVDKFSESSIQHIHGEDVNIPIINNCELHYECRVIAKTQVKPEFIDDTIKNEKYSQGDYHTIFYGEILNCYRTDL